MDKYKVKWTQLQARIFQFLCVHSGQQFNLRAIAKQLKVSPTAVSNVLPDLEKDGLIKIEKSKTMNLMSISLNRDSESAIKMKRVENLRAIYDSGLDNFLLNEFSGCTIILFGSYSRGEDVYYGKEDDRSSDVDIAIIGTKEKNLDLSVFEDKIERKISLNFYASWNDIHKNLKNNILNGITLHGGIDA